MTRSCPHKPMCLQILIVTIRSVPASQTEERPIREPVREKGVFSEFSVFLLERLGDFTPNSDMYSVFVHRLSNRPFVGLACWNDS